MKFGLAVPSGFWALSQEDKQRSLSTIHDAGFDHLFMADHVSFRNGNGTDGFVEVAALSQLHPVIGVMISIYLLPLRHPLPVARQLATMGRVAPGRMIFGIGIGGDDRHEVEVCGVDPRTRGARTNESLQIIRELLQGGTVTFHGDHFDVDEAVIRPIPDPAIPVLVGGRSDAALRRAGAYADGWIGAWCSTTRFKTAVHIVSETAAEAGRPDVSWLHGYQPWLGVGASREEARSAVARQMEAFYKVPFEQFERYTPYGTPDEVAEFLAAYIETGCRLFNMKICTPDPADEIAMGSEVMDVLRTA